MLKFSIQDEISRRILVLDGGLGTMVQGYDLSEEDYRGDRFAKWEIPLKGYNDLLVLTDGSAAWFNGQRIDNPNTHGTGCTLSSAIASNLAKGYDLETAVRRAKAYISGALAAMLDLGHGSGPMNHAFALDNEWSKEAEA